MLNAVYFFYKKVCTVCEMLRSKISDTIKFPKYVSCSTRLTGWLHKYNTKSLCLTLKHINLDFMGLKSILNLFA